MPVLPAGALPPPLLLPLPESLAVLPPLVLSAEVLVPLALPVLLAGVLLAPLAGVLLLLLPVLPLSALLAGVLLPPLPLPALLAVLPLVVPLVLVLLALPVTLVVSVTLPASTVSRLLALDCVAGLDAAGLLLLVLLPLPLKAPWHLSGVRVSVTRSATEWTPSSLRKLQQQDNSAYSDVTSQARAVRLKCMLAFNDSTAEALYVCMYQQLSPGCQRPHTFIPACVLGIFTLRHALLSSPPGFPCVLDPTPVHHVRVYSLCRAP